MTSTISRIVRADCGHDVDTSAHGCGTGMARNDDDSTMCYPCADESQRAAIAGADTFGGYVSADRRRITTWTGGELARVTYHGVGDPQYTATGGRWSTRYVRAVTPDGRRWYGRGNADWDCIRLRAARHSG
jgi:hypothetical protein